MHNKDNPVLALTRLTTMKTMMTIGKDQEPPQTRPSLMWKSVTRGVNAEAYLQGAWDTMP